MPISPVPLKAHTPPPWRFELNPKHHHATLYGGGRLVVMDLVRWGMQGAMPRFRDDECLMFPAVDFAKPHPARRHHAEWFQIVEHPDARLIEQAPRLLAALERIVDCIDRPDIMRYEVARATIAEAKAAIEAATSPAEFQTAPQINAQ